MNEVFNKPLNYNDYIHLFNEPMDIDYKSRKNYKWYKEYLHCIDATFIFNNKMLISKRKLIKDKIDSFYFIYVDKGLNQYDDKYWFCIGKIKDKNNDIYFSYESMCNGTGFGLGEITTIYYSKDKDMLLKYGITDKHRNFIEKYKKIYLLNENMDLTHTIPNY